MAKKKKNSITPTYFRTFDMKKEDLISIAAKCQERTFSDEVDFLEQLGGIEIFQDKLGVDYERGISSVDVEARRAQYGTNRKEEVPPKSIFKLIWDALEDFTLRVLLVSASISVIANMIVEEDHRDIAWIEGFAIFMAVAVCATVSAVNDYQKEKQFRALQEFANSKKLVTVWRDAEVQINPADLVSGDLIKITEGMEVPADILLLEAHEVASDESAMTGETELVKKNIFKRCVEKRDHIISEGNKNSSGHYDVYSPVLLSGTKVQTGAGKGIVLVVGKDSCVGRIQSFLEQEAEATPLQQKLETIAKDIGKFGLICASITLIILIIRLLVDLGTNDAWDDGDRWLNLVSYFIIAITVVVVAIPEGLPLSVTLSLAFSVKKMLKEKNLVRKLQATETMGGANAICSDKTGTLTQNKMTLTNIWNAKDIPIESYSQGKLSDLFKKESHIEIMTQALACNNTATLKSKDSGSKTEIALLEFLERFGIDAEEFKAKVVPKDARIFPFNSSRKRMSVVVETGSEKKMHLKGASEIVLGSCDKYFDFEQDKIVQMTEELRKTIEENIDKLANQALRTLCIAYKEVTGSENYEAKDPKGVLELEKSGFTLIGILGIRDILRKEVKGAVARCKKAGIKVRMVTGDNKITAAAIARECGIIDTSSGEPSIVLEGPEFIERVGGIVCKNCRKDKDCTCPRNKAEATKQKKEVRVDTIANAAEFDKIYQNLDVLARSRPDDKYALVCGLIERGAVVAVTGDGTNDAPALKRADVGFAMNSGTAVAKEAADIILIDDNFASIVEAAKWGRNIYVNIQKFLQFQLCVNIVAVIVTLVSAAVLREPLIRAVNLLWINLIMDTLASLALDTEPPADDILDRPPVNRNDYIITRTMAKHVFGQAILQIIIMLTFAFSADKWFPEYRAHVIDPKTGLDPYYSTGLETIRSGRSYEIAEFKDDYKRFETAYGPSVHFTVIFNTFVWLQIFNFFCARFIRDEKSLFKDVTKNTLFMIIVPVIIGIQIFIVQVGGRALNCSFGGLDIRQWLICIGFGSLTWPWNLMLKFIKIKECPRFGNKMTDMFKEESNVLKLRRPKQDTLVKKYSSLSGKNSGGSGTIPKVMVNPSS